MIASDRLFEPFTHGHDVLPPRLHLRRPPGLAPRWRMANLDIFEREGLNEHVLDNAPDVPRAPSRSCSTCRSSATSAATGYFYGIELVKDKATRETFDDDESERLLRGFLSKALFDAGLYCRADDRGDPVIQLAPPLIMRPGAVRRDRVPAALGAHGGREPPLGRGGHRPGSAPALVGWCADCRRPRLCPVRGRQRRRRRRRCWLHRALDRLLPAARPARPSTCWCSRPSTSASGQAGATAAGSRRSTPWGPDDPGPRARARRGPGHAARPARHGRRGRCRRPRTRASTAGSAKGGTISLARSAAQATRARAEAAARAGVG